MVIMKEIKSPQEVKNLLGEEISKQGQQSHIKKGFLAERHVVTVDKSGEMGGLKMGSRQTSEQEYTSRAEGKEHRDSVSENSKYYREQP
jgi:hypothetical protein